jgi:hypothetical protein
MGNNRVAEIYDELRAATTPAGNGKVGLPIDRVARIVREEPELCAVLCEGLVLFSQGKQSEIQLAIAVAAVYEAEYDDDSLSQLVRGHMADLGIQVQEPRVVGGGGATQEESRVIQVAVSEEELAACDIYPLVLSFSHHSVEKDTDLARLRQLRGRVYLTFPVPVEDPREVWEVPEVLAYVRKLSSAMPYFPYYLSPDPRLAMLQIYLLPLIEPEAIGAGGELDLFHPSVLAALVGGVYSALRLGEALGDDAVAMALRELLAPLGDDYTNKLFEAMEARDGDDD